MNQQISLESILKLKIDLLCSGLYVSPKLLQRLFQENECLFLGRKGGAGPAGGRYFEFANGSVVNVLLYTEKPSSCYLILEDLDNKNYTTIYNLHTKQYCISLTLIGLPAFYQQQTQKGIPFNQIALLHGKDTLASTVNQHCVYWRTNQQCQFCGIEFSLQNGSTIAFKTGDQLVDVIRTAQKENHSVGKHITLTCGSGSDPDKGIQIYLPIVKQLKQSFPNLYIHIQIEPIEHLELFHTLHQLGVTSIGIHLELWDDQLRQKICPGKNMTSKEQYFENWDYAVKIFGKNQVSSFLLTGLNQSVNEIKQGITQITDHYVLPFLTPTRAIPGVRIPIPFTDSTEFLELILFAAQQCKTKYLNPNENLAGCIRCGGCSPLIDAFNLLTIQNNL